MDDEEALVEPSKQFDHLEPQFTKLDNRPEAHSTADSTSRSTGLCCAALRVSSGFRRANRRAGRDSRRGLRGCCSAVEMRYESAAKTRRVQRRYREAEDLPNHG